MEMYLGGISLSIWGFKGLEDLGSGMKVNFNFEGYFSSDMGMFIIGLGFSLELFCW